MRDLIDRLNSAFGDRRLFCELIDTHWPEIDRALRARDAMLAALHAIDEYPIPLAARNILRAAIAKAEGRS